MSQASTPTLDLTLGPKWHTLPLQVAPRSGLRVSVEDFWDLCMNNPDVDLERTAEGEVIVLMPTGSETGIRNMSLGGQVWTWNRTTGLGVVLDSSGGFRLPNTAVRAADVSWIARERWEAMSSEEREKFAPICPDFVIELVSPSQGRRRHEVEPKMREYLAQGVRLGWLIDPFAAEAEIYRPGQVVETLARPKTLSGEAVLPGFVLNLDGIWAEEG